MTKLSLAPGQSPADLLKQHMKGGKRSKYGNKRTNGYDSQAESDYADRLATLQRTGAIRDWLEQVSIELDADISYRVDFMIIDRDWTVRFVEVKGYWTKEALLKMKLLESRRPEIFKRLEFAGSQLPGRAAR